MNPSDADDAMEPSGTEQRPLRVAVVGAGPAGFYIAQHLFAAKELSVQVDMFDRLPTPFGLVRYGVAPDHPKIKSVTAVYHKLATDPRFRFYGNVEYGRDLSLVDLKARYHQVVITTGAQTDRRLNIPGEESVGSYSATEFVAWYNGHPDFVDLKFDLDRESAVVIGVGNVAVDVARILCRTPDELTRTDIADYALEALRESRVREVYLIGRRGPSQAAFSNPELKELGRLEDAVTRAPSEEVELDEVSRRALEESPDRMVTRKLEMLRSFAEPTETVKRKRLTMRFLRSPVEILGDGHGHVRALRLVRNELVLDDRGSVRPRATDDFEELQADMVFRAVGYRGIQLPYLPFHGGWGVLPNEKGRVMDPVEERPLAGIYAAGWIKRGPSGIIGTNKPDAGETVACMLEDLRDSQTLRPTDPEVGSIERALTVRGVRFISYEEWQRLDALEVSRGERIGRPRRKFRGRKEFLAALND